MGIDDPEEDVVTAAPPDDAEQMDELDAAEIEEVPPALEPFEKLLARGQELSPGEVRRALQSLLFVADRPLTLDALHGASGIPEDALRDGLTALTQEWSAGASGVVLTEVAEGWQLRSEPASAEFIRRLFQVKPQRLTRAALETLAVVAYRQPVTRAEIEDVRGVDCGAVVKALLERRLVKILGKKEEVGRPLLYGTTREFLEFFALKDLGALPTLREFHELSEEDQELVDREPEVPGVAGTVEALADSDFVARTQAQQRASEEALGELEEAISQADVRARAAAQALAPHPESGLELTGETEQRP